MNGFIRFCQSVKFSLSAKFVAMENRHQRRVFRKRYAFFYGRNAIGSFPVVNKTQSPKSFARWTKNHKKTFLRSIMTLTREIPGNKTLFLFSSLKEEDSLTAGLLGDSGAPSFSDLLQVPSRYLHTKDGRSLAERVGELTARIMVLAITQPRILYATNPATLTYFLKEMETRWKEVRVRLKGIPPELMRLSDKNGERLLMTFLIRDKAPALQELLPDLKAVITWDGGYVQPFLEQLKARLPGVTFIPMYSMSTETIETLPHRIGGRLCFFPLSRGSFPEFEEPETGKVLTPFELEVGKTYELIMNDEWGLRRFATGDMFLVQEIVAGLPDLVFVKKKGLASSLVGEKLTEEQVRELSSFIGKKFPALYRKPLSLYPVSRGGEYGYELAVIGKEEVPEGLAEAAERELKKLNTEYASKVSARKLLPLSTAALSEEALAELTGQEFHWESQLKVLPLNEKLVTR